MGFPHIYINVIDPKFQSTPYWKTINSKYNRNNPKWFAGKKIYEKNMNKWDKMEYTAFVIYIATIYRAHLIKQVKDRRWEKFWIPLSKAYLRKKQREGKPENIWIYTMKLINSISISYIPSKKMVKVGIDGRLTYKGKKVNGKPLKVLLVAKWMEYGTIKMPPRPLFRRSKDYISKHISKFYKDFQSMIS